jgi:hypothetical protein
MKFIVADLYCASPNVLHGRLVAAKRRLLCAYAFAPYALAFSSHLAPPAMQQHATMPQAFHVVSVVLAGNCWLSKNQPASTHKRTAIYLSAKRVFLVLSCQQYRARKFQICTLNSTKQPTRCQPCSTYYATHTSTKQHLWAETIFLILFASSSLDDSGCLLTIRQDRL